MRRRFAMVERFFAVLAALVVSATGLAFAQIQGVAGAEPCGKAPHCAWSAERNLITHETRTPDLGFTYAYPFTLPPGGGGVAGVAINSRGHFWAFQRNAPGKPQLFEFDQNYKLVRSTGRTTSGSRTRTATRSRS